MPFSVELFRDMIGLQPEGSAREELENACERYGTLRTPLQKARCIRSMMTVFDTSFDEPVRRTIMEACGCRCLGNSVVAKALLLQCKARDLDELLVMLNDAHIGGGNLHRKECAIYATYSRCHCGSVSKTKECFSPTYCHCSCGWFRRLFEALLQRPVDVELLGSIIQGEKACRFVIRF